MQLKVNIEKLEGRSETFRSLVHTPTEGTASSEDAPFIKDARFSKDTPSKEGVVVDDPRNLILILIKEFLYL